MKTTIQKDNKQTNQSSLYSFPYHYLDLKVEEYRLYKHVEYLNYLDVAKNLLQPFVGQSILDVGCGDGRFSYELYNENVRIVGVDLSQQAIAFARAFNPDIEFYENDIRNVEFSYKFDYVVLIETLEHIPPTDIPSILKKIFSLLKNDGRLLVTVPSTKTPLVDKHYQHFTENTLRETLKDYFEVEKCLGCSRIGLHWYFFSIARKISKHMLFSFIGKITIVKKYFEFLSDYYKKYFGLGNADNCFRLVAICRKVVR